MNYKELIEKEIEYLKMLPTEKIGDVINRIHWDLTVGRIITSGMGKAGHIANTFATTLSSTGTPSFFLHPAEAQHGDLGVIMPGDIVIVFSNSGKTKEILELIELIHALNYGNLIFAVVGESNSNISTRCADYIEFGKVEEICPLGLTPTTSTTCMSVISDLIVVGLMKRNVFTKEKYSKLHHGGYLGQKSKN
ncbi:MAG: SIS domain-containing protein [Spirochaetia bacterium]|nr:SIS domain-containing protein [Spirochaetia bacterium]